MSGELCPTPKKTRFATLTSAQSAARRAGFALQKSLRPYENCPCGWIHLTSREDGHEQRESLLTDGPVDDVMFALVVRDDVAGRCSAEDAALLRTPENMVRWATALKTYQIDLAAQVAMRQGLYDDATRAWRKRVQRIGKALREKRAEAKIIMHTYYQTVGQTRVPSPGGPAATELKEKRRIAGQRAIMRLKDAHPDEFKRYLAEEYIADGLDLTGSLAEYAPAEKETET